MEGSSSGVPLYDEFSGEYDVMVSWAGRLQRESPFFETAFRDTGARRVLDVGCGTGWHAIHFARLGLEAVGADPSVEMVKRARENAQETSGLSFVTAGFGQLRDRLAGVFDVVTCLGNTLPHLLTEADLRGGLEDMAAVLRPGGLMVVQQLNYDRILARRQRFLGVSSGRRAGHELLFFRFYDFEDPLLNFNVVTLQPGDRGWDFRVRSTRLQPIRSDQLERLLLEAGFGSPQFFGNYERQEYRPLESEDLIAVAQRL